MSLQFAVIFTDEEKFKGIDCEASIYKRYFEGVRAAYSDRLLNNREYIFDSEDFLTNFGTLISKPKVKIYFVFYLFNYYFKIVSFLFI